MFAGGDDLFLIGPWNRMTELALRLRESFAEYVCCNKEIHFSAGITLHKAHTSIKTMAKDAEHALEASKKGERREKCTESEPDTPESDRNRMTLFSETVTWDELEKLIEIREEIQKWMDDGWINNAMMYRFNLFIDMAEQEKRILETGDADADDISCLKWQSRLAYTIGRNVGRGIKDDAKLEKRISASTSAWLTKYGGKFKIPVWDSLYNSR